MGLPLRIALVAGIFVFLPDSFVDIPAIQLKHDHGQCEGHDDGIHRLCQLYRSLDGEHEL